MFILKKLNWLDDVTYDVIIQLADVYVNVGTCAPFFKFEISTCRRLDKRRQAEERPTVGRIKCADCAQTSLSAKKRRHA